MSCGESDISPHSHRLELYKAFLDFRSHFKANGAIPTRAAVWDFHAQTSLADFYFSDATARAFSTAAGMAATVRRLEERLSDSENEDSAELPRVQDERNRVYWQLDDALDKLESEIETTLRLVPSRGLRLT